MSHVTMCHRLDEDAGHLFFKCKYAKDGVEGADVRGQEGLVCRS